MVYAAIGGMQLKRWSGYFRIILPTMKVLNAAKHADGCIKADSFKANNVFFAISVWKDRDHMQAFARSGLHAQLTHVAMDQMSLFFNYTETFEAVPDRAATVTAWQSAITARDGNGTVGTLRK